MSENRWDEIEFDKIPSKAGFVYRNAFARRDIIKAKYEKFIKDETTTVNAGALYPYEVVAQAFNYSQRHIVSRNWARYTFEEPKLDDIERLTINKYWDNLTDYLNGCDLNALAIVDTSMSMWGHTGSAPMNVAISLGLYCAERAKGPFANHYISFSSRPQLIETSGIDFVDKVQRIYSTNLCENTNIEATFDMLLETAIQNNCAQSDLPKKIIIISDMEFDCQTSHYGRETGTLMENIALKWNRHGYKMPELVFWNVNARQDNIPMKVQNGVTFVSGFSPVLFEQIMKNKSAIDLILDKLDSERYACIK